MNQNERLSLVPELSTASTETSEAELSRQPSPASRTTVEHWIHSVLSGEAAEIPRRVNTDGVIETHTREAA